MSKHCKDKDCKENHYSIGAYRYHYKPKSSPISKPKQKAIKPFSDKQKSRLKEYRKVRDAYMKIHTVCEARLENCTYQSTDIHHQFGRIGDLLVDSNYFLALCRSCHTYIETHSEIAYRLGFSLKRLDK